MAHRLRLEMTRRTSGRMLQLGRRPVGALAEVGPMTSRNATGVRAAAAAAAADDASWPRVVVDADTAAHPTRLDTVVAGAAAAAGSAAESAGAGAAAAAAAAQSPRKD